MPLAIGDCGANIRRTISFRTETAASFRLAASPGHTARWAEPAARTAATKTAAMVSTASAGRPRAAIRSATAMGTSATPTTVTAATVLSECWIWRDRKTDESSQCEEGSKKIKAAHNPYLPSNAGEQFRARSLCTRTARSYLIRFYSSCKGLHPSARQELCRKVVYRVPVRDYCHKGPTGHERQFSATKVALPTLNAWRLASC